jgi:outer membrane protein OmpA-like peptidoglycan-associated protein
MKNMRKRIVYTILLVAMAYSVQAQTSYDEWKAKKMLEENSSSKAWEFGIGGSIFQFSRTSFSNFVQLESGYLFTLKLDHAAYGGNLYAARELNDHFYVDLQGTIGTTGNKPSNTDQIEWLYMVGAGLQWRLGEYFGSKYIDPYLRAGVNYMHKEFDILYAGTEGLDDEQMKWVMNNLNNKSGLDRKDLIPISLGLGINMWLNDRWGIGMQGDYLLMPYDNVANSLQGTVRLMYRLGGKSKSTSPDVQYVDRNVVVEKMLSLDGIFFDFDKADIKPNSNAVLDKIARLLKQDGNKRYLITGYTDSRGNDDYNLQLSRKRAEAIIRALTDRGVPPVMLKARGVGSKIAHAKPSDPDEVRYGDRKMTIELITNRAYWDNLPETGF